MATTKVRIWEKDAVSNDHVRKETLRGKVYAGPSDSHISICIPGMKPIYPSSRGNFRTFIPGTNEFDAVHTFSVIRMTLALYESDHLFDDPFEWNTDGNLDPITVYPHEPADEINSYYCREDKDLVFFYAPSTIYQKTTVYACRSFDCVAHETGHAILDDLKPGWYSDELPPQTGALHESFADLTAIFLELSQKDQVEAVISQTGGNLRKKNFVALFAEELGNEFGRPHGLRNANKNCKISNVSSEVHDLSRVFTGAIYRILSNIFNYEKMRCGYDKDSYPQILFDLASDLRIQLLQAIKASPDDSASFKDVAEQLVDNTHSQEHRSIMEREFQRREIFGEPAVQSSVSGNGIQLRHNCCFMMKRISEREREARKAQKRAARRARKRNNNGHY